MSNKVTIGIPTYNGWLRIHQLLQNIEQRTPKSIPYEVVVCDDSGKEEHRDRVKGICKDLGAEYVFHQNNRGVPAAWNTLSRSTDSKHIILLNDDVLVARDWLLFPYYALENNKNIGSFGLHCYFISPGDVATLLQGPDAKVIPLDVKYVNGVLVKDQRFSSMPENTGGVPGRTMCPTGCAFGFTREVYNGVGGFDERYQAFYEETDFGVACSVAGLPSVQLPYPGNYHIWSQTFASAPEINASKIMNDSKRKFVQKWSEKLNYKFNDAPDIHNLIMDKIPPLELKWLDENLIEKISYV